MVRVAAGDELDGKPDDDAKAWRVDVEGLAAGCPFTAMQTTKNALQAWQHPLLAAAFQQCASTDLTNC